MMVQINTFQKTDGPELLGPIRHMRLQREGLQGFLWRNQKPTAQCETGRKPEGSTETQKVVSHRVFSVQERRLVSRVNALHERQQQTDCSPIKEIKWGEFLFVLGSAGTLSDSKGSLKSAFCFHNAINSIRNDELDWKKNDPKSNADSIQTVKLRCFSTSATKDFYCFQDQFNDNKKFSLKVCMK